MNKKLLLYIIFITTISLLSVLIFRFIGGKYLSSTGSLLAMFYMFIPTISVLIVEKIIFKEKIKDTCKISFKINRWFFIAWILMPIINIGALGVSLLIPGINFSPDMQGLFERYEKILSPEQISAMKQSLAMLPIHPFWLTLMQGLIAGITINAIFAFGEELGWRGFLVYELRNMKFLKTSLIIGFIWGLWHSPLILMGHNYPEHPQIGVLMMTIFCILITPIFLYITIKAKSVIASSIMHGTLNATAGLPLMMIVGGNDLTAGITGLAGFIILIITNLIIFYIDTFILKDKIILSKIVDKI